MEPMKQHSIWSYTVQHMTRLGRSCGQGWWVKPLDIIDKLSTISNLFNLKLMFRCHLTPSTDHATRENHVMNWDQVKVLGHESDRKTRWIKEAIEIRKSKDKCMNRDTGSYFLSTSFDKFLLRESARFHGNNTSRRRVDSFSVLRQVSDDTETSTLN